MQLGIRYCASYSDHPTASVAILNQHTIRNLIGVACYFQVSNCFCGGIDSFEIFQLDRALILESLVVSMIGRQPGFRFQNFFKKGEKNLL